jgi:hypothetical protein
MFKDVLWQEKGGKPIAKPVGPVKFESKKTPMRPMG